MKFYMMVTLMILCTSSATLGLAAPPAVRRELTETNLLSLGLFAVPDGQLRCPSALAKLAPALCSTSH